MGGHSTSDDPSRYVPAEQMEEWSKKDPIRRFERFLEAAGLWKEGDRDAVYAECLDEMSKAAAEAEAVEKPALETIFTDVYAELPEHLRKQGQELFELGKRRGDADAGDGEFPL